MTWHKAAALRAAAYEVAGAAVAEKQRRMRRPHLTPSPSDSPSLRGRLPRHYVLVREDAVGDAEIPRFGGRETPRNDPARTNRPIATAKRERYRKRRSSAGTLT